MKIRSIELDEDQNPAAATVTMSASEALMIALVFGKMTGDDESAIMPDGEEIGYGIYGALTGGLFNRFYVDGVDEAARELGVQS